MCKYEQVSAGVGGVGCCVGFDDAKLFNHLFIADRSLIRKCVRTFYFGPSVGFQIQAPQIPEGNEIIE